MTTDLKSMTVEELFDDNFSHEDWEVVAKEIARRLEEAQQKIVALQAILLRNGYAGSDIPMAELAAHDAEAKAEALEEAKEMAEIEANEYNESEGFKYAELQTNAETALNYFAVALGDKAAEYRAKAGRKE